MVIVSAHVRPRDLRSDSKVKTLIAVVEP